MTPDQRYRQQAGCRRKRENAYKLWESRKGEIDWLIHSQHWPQSRIGSYYGVTQTAINRVMIRHGIKPKCRANYGSHNGRYRDGTQSRLYRQMIEKDKCSECGVTECLAIHHKNGNHLDNHLENLQGLCWSCHNRKTKTLYWEKIKESGAAFPLKRTKRGTFTRGRAS